MLYTYDETGSRNMARVLPLAVFLCLLFASPAHAETKVLKRFFPKSFAHSVFKVSKSVKVTEESSKSQEQSTTVQAEEAPKVKGPRDVEFQTSNIKKKTFLPPDQTPPVAINPNAPASAISMIESNRKGDRATAKAYAKQYVRMLQNYFFEIKDLTGLIGDALIEERLIQQEDWIGAQQAIDLEFAKTRLEKGVIIKPTNDVAMKRIVPDPKNQAEVFFFFRRTCSYCRHMAADVERLSRAFKGDKRVKVTGLIVGDVNPEWLEGYKEHTGLNIPIYDGTDFAKSLNLAFFPVLVVAEPNAERSYFKTGQQSFETMYEFVRTVQGLPVKDSGRLQAIVRTPIGEREKLLVKQGKGEKLTIAQHFGEKATTSKVRFPRKKRVEVDTF